MIFQESDFINAGYHDLRICLELFLGNLTLILDFGQNMFDAVDSGLFLIVGADNGPWRN